MNSSSRVRSLVVAIVTSTAVTLLGSASEARAQACGMGDVDWYAVERANVARASGLLEDGEPRKAAWLLQRTWPRLREAVPVASSMPVIADGVRLMALATVRADGDVRSGYGWSSWTAEERAANVAWGVKRLRMLALARPPSDALVKTDLAEALARSPATRDEARAILEALYDSHGVATPEGYAALTLLRSMAGDLPGAEVARLECDRRAKRLDLQCDAMGGRVTPALAPATKPAVSAAR